NLLHRVGAACRQSVGGALNVALFDPEDPFAERRELDDTQFSLDHFQRKLLRLPETMQTVEGRRMANDSARFLVQFMARLSAELGGDYSGSDERIAQRFALQP
ncbi:MAG TPA: hydrolase, partial [Enterobacteriaceae bacterium]|nr:hydrolase [Enterobacteriaceae bacterium]